MKGHKPPKRRTGRYRQEHYDWTIQQCLDKTKEIEKDPKNQAGDGLLKKSAWHKIQDLSFAVSMKMAEGGKA